MIEKSIKVSKYINFLSPPILLEIYDVVILEKFKSLFILNNLPITLEILFL